MATTPFSQHDHWFKIHTPLGPDVLLLEGFSGQEAISSLFRFHLDLIAENQHTIAFEDLLAQKISIELQLSGGDARYFHGILNGFSQGGRNLRFTRYSAELVPQFWLLTRQVRSRIFQHITVPDILKKVLDGLDVSWETQGTFQPRDYCVQYRESDFQFASRLMEEEGIYYFFKHTADSHQMVLANSPQSHPEISDPSRLIYDEVEGGTRDEERIVRWEKSQDLRSGKYTLWDHSFELPGKHLEAEKSIIETAPVGKVVHKLKVGGNDGLEIYDYPGGYAQRFDGVDPGGADRASELQKIFDDSTRTVGIRMQQEALPSLTINAASQCGHLVSGHKFTLTRHFNADGVYVITSLSHSGQHAYGTGPDNQLIEPSYSNTFTCIPFALPFRPPRVTPRPFVHGSHTATVAGPAGEEIFTDKYGRVKVQFHWDREGQNDANSSCWVRVGTPWAGQQWGMIHVPRVNQEVIVQFLEGDPDQPIIVGSVYNAEQMPPYALPDNKTQSGIRSRSSKSGTSENYNEIKFEDNKGSELITIHAEKDQLIEVENDETIKIHHDQMITVENDRTETVKNNETVTIQGDRKHYVTGQEQLQTDADLHLTASQNQNEKVGMNYSRSVGMNINDKAGMNYAMDAGMMIHLKAGMSAVIEAGMGLTIKSSGGSIDINPVGVFLQGNLVFINSGAANIAGCGSSPTSPTSPVKKILDGLEQPTGAAPAAAASVAPSLAQQAQQQVSVVSSMAANIMGTVSNQAFAAVSQVAEQSLAAAQLEQTVANQLMGQINDGVKQAQSTMATAVNQAQGMLNAGMNAVRTGVQKSANQASAAASQLANQASQLEQQAQQQLQQAANDAQQAAQQAVNQGQRELGQELQQGEQMLNQARQTANQAEQQLQQASNQAQQAANQAVQQGQQGVNLAAQQAAQMANQAQQTANHAAQQAQAAANQLQQTANQAAQQGQQQVAQAAGQAQQAANQAAHSAQLAANQAQQLAQQTQQQAQQMMQQTQQQVTRAATATQQQVTQAANQAQQQVTQATQQATQQATEAGQMTQQTANQVQHQVGAAAAQAAKTVGNTAQAACQQAGAAANQAAQNMQQGLG